MTGYAYLVVSASRLWQSCLRAVIQVSSLTRGLSMWLAAYMDSLALAVGVLLVSLGLPLLLNESHPWGWVAPGILALLGIASLFTAFVLTRRREAAEMRERRELIEERREQSLRERELYEHQKSLWEHIECQVVHKEPPNHKLE